MFYLFFVLVCKRYIVKLTCVYSVLIHTFVILDTYHHETYMYVTKEVRIPGYFSKPKGARDRRDTALDADISNML